MATRGVYEDGHVFKSLTLPGIPAIAAGIGKVSVAFTPSSVSANTTAVQTVNVAGLQPGDAVLVSPPAAVAGTGIVGAFVAAAGVLSLVFSNSTGGALTPAAGNYTVVVIR